MRRKLNSTKSGVDSQTVIAPDPRTGRNVVIINSVELNILIGGRKMKKAAMSRSTVLLWTAVIIVGIGSLVFFAPILAAILFVVLITAGAIAVGRKEGGWKGFVAFAKNLIFGW